MTHSAVQLLQGQLFPCTCTESKIWQKLAWKRVAYPADVMRLMEIIVMPMSNAYRTSLSRIVVVVLPFGTSTHMSPFPVVWKTCLLAAVIGQEAMGVKLIRWWWNGVMWWEAPES